eukprot:5534746-Pleurochrysis_carterae.AAC.1
MQVILCQPHVAGSCCAGLCSRISGLAIASAAGAAGCGRGCDETTCERPSAQLEAGCAISDTPYDATLAIGSNMPVLKATTSQRSSSFIFVAAAVIWHIAGSN